MHLIQLTEGTLSRRVHRINPLELADVTGHQHWDYCYSYDKSALKCTAKSDLYRRTPIPAGEIQMWMEVEETPAEIAALFELATRDTNPAQGGNA